MGFLLLTAALLLGSCSSIDEDLDNCGHDYELNYELRLVTNMTTELQTQLNTQTDVHVADALRHYLQNIFSDFAHDVDLSFYDTQDDSTRLHHEAHIMDANQSSYTLYLPMRQYMHMAVANITDNNQVSLTQDELCHTARLQQVQADTLRPHSTGLFTARQPMDVLADRDQTFNVKLYMVNCATALVLDTTRAHISRMEVLATGFASSFSLADSTYSFPTVSPIFRTDELSITEGNEACFCSVNMPSRELPTQRLVIETTEPFVTQGGQDALWQYKVYITLPNGKITETILNVNAPLRAGQLKIIKGKVDDMGVVRPTDASVGVSIRLDWNPGMSFDPQL